MPGLLSLVACALIAQPGAEVVLRSHEPAPAGTVQAVSIEGVVVGSSVTAKVIVGWDRVREVRGPHAEEAQAFAETADLIWRARTRLERGDVPAAEPLFERLFVTFKDRRGPTAAAVCEGLLRCRLRRNAHTLAVDAWLSWLHARQPGDGPQWYQRRSPAMDDGLALPIDEATGLLPDLPPIWLGLPAVRSYARGEFEKESLGVRELELATLYRHAAILATGGAAQMPRATGSDAGLKLVWDIVAAGDADDATRTAGRRAIEARLKRGTTGWEDAWIRTALGRSLLLDVSAEERRRGVIELLRVRVMHESDCPYLAGLALAQAAAALAEMGDLHGAAALRRQLLDRFPGHPAAAWEPIADMTPDGASAAASNASGGSGANSNEESRAANG